MSELTDYWQAKNKKTICIVGSRRYTTYGFDAVRNIIEGLRDYDVAIVSGLALGIDTIVHTQAIENGLPCIAVPGSGLNEDVLYPRANAELAKQIIENGGVLVSEFEPEMRATPWGFPMRNRIMAGMSDATLIIEAEKDSGTLITARLAVDYGRKVMAIPHSIFSPTGEGCNYVIKENAESIVTCAQEIIDALKLELK